MGQGEGKTEREPEAYNGAILTMVTFPEKTGWRSRTGVGKLQENGHKLPLSTASPSQYNFEVCHIKTLALSLPVSNTCAFSDGPIHCLTHNPAYMSPFYLH